MSLPAVLDELALELPEAHLLVIDDGSVDATAAIKAAYEATARLGLARGRR